jgi:hypothetical protein
MSKKTPLGCWRQAIKLMRDAGFPFVVVNDLPEQSWDGKKARLIHPSKSFSSLSDAIHEFAHWLVASKKERSKPEFGLGYAPDAIAHTEGSCNQKTEEQASLLGIAIERELGMPWKKTACNHSWVENNGLDVSEYVRKHGGKALVKKGLIGPGLRWTRRTEWERAR